MDLTAKTPAEVDTLWVPLMVATNNAHYRLIAAAQSVTRAEKQGIGYYTERAVEHHAAAEAAYAEAVAAEVPFNAEWARRGGWIRAYLAITNGRGHIHRTTECSTCHRGIERTALTILPQVSGLTDAEIVELAGERACTVCYPDAPVETLSRATRLFSEDEVKAQAEREARRAERERKAGEKAAKAITNPDGSKLVVDGWEVKTERTAWTQVVDFVLYHRAFNYQPHTEDIAKIIAALAAKLGKSEDEIRDEIEAKVVAKAKREKIALPA